MDDAREKATREGELKRRRNVSYLVNRLIDSFPDIEKRKSFADMKLAEVASGRSVGSFSFEREDDDERGDDDDDDDTRSGSEGDDSKRSSSPLRREAAEAGATSSTPDTDEEEGGGLRMGVLKKRRQQQQQGSHGSSDNSNSGNSSSSFDSPESPDSPKAAAGQEVKLVGNGTVSERREEDDADPMLLVESAVAHTVVESSSTRPKEKLDPVVEVCSDLEVKIADLGNACWVVSAIGL